MTSPTLWRHRWTVLLTLLGLFATGPSEVRAEMIEVSVPGSRSPGSTLELRDGQVADVTVYLKSLGDIVEGKKVAMRDARTGKTRQELISDRDGTVRFLGLVPAKYHVTVEKTLNDRGGASTVSIGDLRLVARNR